MKIIAQSFLTAALLGATAWTSATMGFRHGKAVASVPAVQSIAADMPQDHWQYQTYSCGKKSDSIVDRDRISQVINLYGAKGFEPCAAPTHIFPDGVQGDRLIWFRREFSPFSPSITSIADNLQKPNG